MTDATSSSPGSSRPTNATTPRVSVAMITYNHERFLAEAVESAVRQETAWPYEIVVGEDCSTDGTRRVLQELAARYPERVVPLYHEKNLGLLGKRNLAETLARCRGDFVVILEGDDFWNSPHKLQRQVDFLLAHPECSACFHAVAMQGPDGVRIDCATGFPDGMDRIGPRELLRHGFPHLMSLLFRRSALPGFPAWFYELSMGDWSVALLLARQGPLGFLAGETLSTYRLHNTSFWLTRPMLDRTRDEIRAFETFRREFGSEFDAEVGLQINRREFWAIDAHLEKGDRRTAKQVFRSALASWWRHRGVEGRAVLRYARRAYFPALERWRVQKYRGTA